MREWITRRNPIFELMRANRRQIYQLHVARGICQDERLDEVIEHSIKRGVPVHRVEKHELNKIDRDHQGIAAEVSEYPYSQFDEVLTSLSGKDVLPLLLILDTLHDPQNLGTLLRTAEIVLSMIFMSIYMEYNKECLI